METSILANILTNDKFHNPLVFLISILNTFIAIIKTWKLFAQKTKIFTKLCIAVKTIPVFIYSDNSTGSAQLHNLVIQ